MSENLGDMIKEELLTHKIKAPCCKASFIAGTVFFAKSRKNKFTDRIAEYKEHLLHKKQRSFFGDEEDGVGYSVVSKDGRPSLEKGKTCPVCQSMLVRGGFLVSGRASITGGEKKKDYHLEMPVPDSETADLISSMLEAIELVPKRTVRRGELLLYYKKRESIADFIAYIGAGNNAVALMNREIEEDNINHIRRHIVCDTNNIQKALVASKKQQDAIEAICKHGSFDELPVELRETAKIRLENPLEPLGVITKLHNGKISRSAVNRRLHKIIEWAEKKGYIIK